ncbi:MAG: substrate-binding domain-containing protein [bacterium]|nr:substrate-binding domain-containing protein [bacterium]
MATTGKRGTRPGAVLCVLTLLAAACGGGSGAGSAFGLAERPDSGESTDTGAPTAGEGGAQVLTDVSGRVTVSGSSTVEPISVRVAELFRDVAPDVSVTVDGPGTGDGFKLFCAGETDISDASRRIKDAEAEACAEAGIEWIELRVGIDGIAVLTNLENDAVDCLSFEDLYAIVGPESVGFTNWRDAGTLAAELGSSTSFPDLALDITAPGAESGTYDSFIEIVLEHIGEARAEAGAISEDEAATTRPDYVSAGDDNVIIQGIDGSRGSFGWVGFAFTGDADVKLLEIDDGDGCVAATADSIAAGEYPVSRSLFIYVNSARAAASTAVRAYVDFYVSETGLGRAVSDVGYVVLTDDAQATTVADWYRRRIGG